MNNEENILSETDITDLVNEDEANNNPEDSFEIVSEYKNLITKPSDLEYSLLKDSISKEGIREPIIVWDNKIIDGHNRYKIAHELNIPIKYVKKDFDSEEAVKEWIIRNQLGRRNVSKYERARLVLHIKPQIEAMAKSNQGTRNDLTSSPNGQKVNTREYLSKLAGIGHNTLDKVEFLEKEAPQELKEQLRAGTISINAAYKKLAKPKKNATAVPTNLQPSKETPTVPHESITTSNNLETEETLQESTQPEELIDNQSVHVSTNIIDDTGDSTEEDLQKTVNITVYLSYKSRDKSRDKSDEYYELIDEYYESHIPYELSQAILNKMASDDRITSALIRLFSCIGISSSLEEYNNIFLNVENGDYRHSFSINIKDIVID